MVPPHTTYKHWSCIQNHVGSTTPNAYLLSRDEQRWYDFPQHQHHADGYISTTREATTPRALGLDCEMVLTEQGQALARLSLVSLVAEHDGHEYTWPEHHHNKTLHWKPRVLLDLFIKPDAPVVDYLTPVSGITPELLKEITLTREDARQLLCDALYSNDLLCSHALENDLHILGLVHTHILDTSILYPHHDGPPARQALKALAWQHLKRHIQTKTHSSVEDARAALELAKLKITTGSGRLVWQPIPPEKPCIFDVLTLEEALGHLQLNPETVKCVYVRGSRAVGYAGVRDDGTPSDWDLVVVLTDINVVQEDIHIAYGNIDATLYDERTFRALIQECCIWALECIFAPPTFRWKEAIDFRTEFAHYRQKMPTDVLNAKLRRSVSYHSGRQWTKAKQYLEVKGDRYSCRKRIFIAIRFLAYGLEVAMTGKIHDIRCANALWEEHLKTDQRTTWPEFRGTYNPLYLVARQTFRKATPKTPRYAGIRGQLHRARIELKESKTNTPTLYRVEDASPENALGANLATVQFLRACSEEPEVALTILKETFKLGVKRHAQHPNIVQLRYTLRSQPRDHPIVRECRGLILDAARGWSVIAYPFDRFFDLKDLENQELPFDWASARLYDKIDGSLAILYWFLGTWRVASSRRPDASGMMCLRDPGGGILFERLFWEIWNSLGYALPPEPSDAVPLCCYMFEMTSRRHPIVVRHTDENITLIGVRELVHGQERDPQLVANSMGWTVSKARTTWTRADQALGLEGNPSDAQRLTDAALALDGARDEGFVVCDRGFRRIKIKSPDYVRLAWTFPLCEVHPSTYTRRLLSVVLSGETHEFATYCPEHRDDLHVIKQRFDAMCERIHATYNAIATTDAKAFAERAKTYPSAAVLFNMRVCNASAHNVLQGMNIKSVERLLGLNTPQKQSSPTPLSTEPSELEPALAKWCATVFGKNSINNKEQS